MEDGWMMGGCVDGWVDDGWAASLRSVQKDRLTSSLFHFDHFKDSLEVDAGESHDKQETSAVTHQLSLKSKQQDLGVKLQESSASRLPGGWSTLVFFSVNVQDVFDL